MPVGPRAECLLGNRRHIPRLPCRRLLPIGLPANAFLPTAVISFVALFLAEGLLANRPSCECVLANGHHIVRLSLPCRGLPANGPSCECLPAEGRHFIPPRSPTTPASSQSVQEVVPLAVAVRCSEEWATTIERAPVLRLACSSSLVLRCRVAWHRAGELAIRLRVA